ncbi:MAG: NAD(P)H-dependent oxidoreductase subunit E, partial [Deltaproteobacteria bacterium]|nr:NAD(P)H-dependent oxidoreductase subunit E [Deltaproteobacteria bacterium]
MSMDLSAHLQELDNLIAREKAKGGALIPVLHQAQELYGYLPKELQDYIADGLDIPQSTAYGVVT